MRSSKEKVIKIARLVSVLFITLVFTSCVTNQSKKEAMNNKEVVVNLFNEFFVGKDVTAVDRYMGPVYIQHNPMAPDGTDALKGFFQGFWKNFPNPVYSLKRVIAEVDLVAIHYHFKMNEDDRGFAVVDIFRLENGKIVEHWDVVQKVPEKSANQNTMF